MYVVLHLTCKYNMKTKTTLNFTIHVVLCIAKLCWNNFPQRKIPKLFNYVNSSQLSTESTAVVSYAVFCYMSARSKKIVKQARLGFQMNFPYENWVLVVGKPKNLSWNLSKIQLDQLLLRYFTCILWCLQLKIVPSFWLITRA